MTAGRSQRLALVFLRVTLGFLSIWWGLAKGLNLGVGEAVSNTFYGGLFSVDTLLIGFGWFEILLGAGIVLGLWPRYLLSVQLVINGFTAAAVWYAILDPFQLYLPKQTDAAFPQLFYPSIIIVAAGLVLLAFTFDRTDDDRA